MKLYHGGGFTEYKPKDLFDYILAYGLKVGKGKIESLTILERKFLSNEGNALDGIVQCEDKIHSVGLNIGGNPIGTGYQNYIYFLEEMKCKKIGNLYLLNSLIKHELIYLMSGDTLRGYINPKSFIKFEDIIKK